MTGKTDTVNMEGETLTKMKGSSARLLELSGQASAQSAC